MCSSNMREDLKHPSIDAVSSVLTKIGVEPSLRYDSNDQDIEYTTCKIVEIEKYIDLYVKEDTSIYEKRVLGCYFLECLNEFIQEHEKSHKMQEQAFSLLLSDIEIHDTEISYWSDMSDPNKENWWPIAEVLAQWVEQRT